MIVYLARDIPAFVMYCVNGESGSSLLIDSTDSMIILTTIILLLMFIAFIVTLYLQLCTLTFTIISYDYNNFNIYILTLNFISYSILKNNHNTKIKEIYPTNPKLLL